MSTRKKRVGCLVFDGLTALDLVGPSDAFAAATLAAPGQAARPAYEIVTIGVTRRRCVSESGLAIQPSFSLADAPALDTLIIPGGSGLRRPQTNRSICDWVHGRAPKVRRIASVCTGIYGLAPSGLLDGRRVTTHWRFADDVARRFPHLKLEPNELYIKDERFYTTAGITAGIDLALALIEEDLGAASALAIARELVVYLKRPGGQEQFSEPLQFQIASKDRFSDLTAYIVAHLDRDLSVEALAKKLAISPRQLNRQCQDHFGYAPAAFVQRLRLDEARSRLTERASNVELVAASLGFRSADAFRRAFERRFGINPSTYRARFWAGRGRAREPD